MWAPRTPFLAVCTSYSGGCSATLPAAVPHVPVMVWPPQPAIFQGGHLGTRRRLAGLAHDAQWWAAPWYCPGLRRPGSRPQGLVPTVPNCSSRSVRSKDAVWSRKGPFIGVDVEHGLVHDKRSKRSRGASSFLPWCGLRVRPGHRRTRGPATPPGLWVGRSEKAARCVGGPAHPGLWTLVRSRCGWLGGGHHCALKSIYRHLAAGPDVPLTNA